MLPLKLYCRYKIIENSILPFTEDRCMFIKSLIIVAFIIITTSLGTALFHLVKHKDPQDSLKTVKALTWRIGLSVVLFIFVIISIATGLVQPTGIGARMQSANVPTNP